MADDLVSRGLGGDGPVVTGGLGATTPAAPGTIYGHSGGSTSSVAYLYAPGRVGGSASGVASSTANLVDGNVGGPVFVTGSAAGVGSASGVLTDGDAVGPDPTVGSVARLGGWRPQPIPRPIPGVLVGHAYGSSSAAGVLFNAYDADLAAVLLLLDLDLMLTEGVLA